MAKTNYAKYIVLGMLSCGPMTGYEIRKWVKETISYFMMDFSYGQIYPTLAMAERTGLATMHEEKTGGGRSRKVYQLTEKGLEDLQSWLRGPDTGEYELLLKICFGTLIPHDELIRKLAAYQQKRKGEIALLQSWITDLETGPVYGPNTPYYHMITKLGLSYFQDEIEWCKESIEAVEKMKKESK